MTMLRRLECFFSLFFKASQNQLPCFKPVLGSATSHIGQFALIEITVVYTTDYGRPVRKSPSLHGQKSTPTPKFLSTAKAYFVYHIGSNFQVSSIYAFIGCL